MQENLQSKYGKQETNLILTYNSTKVLAAIFDASQFFQWFIENASYLFVFIFMVIESSFIPFPSEVIVPPAAYLACTSHEVDIVVILLLATAGAVAGALINYGLSIWIGRPLVYRFADSKFGHACLIDREKVDKAEAYFDRHGAISTFIGRLIPAVRQLISIPAGLSKMNLGKFVIFTALGAAVWNSILAALGWWLGTIISRDQLTAKVEHYNHYLTYAGLALAAICVGIILYNIYKPRQKSI